MILTAILNSFLVCTYKQYVLHSFQYNQLFPKYQSCQSYRNSKVTELTCNLHLVIVIKKFNSNFKLQTVFFAVNYGDSILVKILLKNLRFVTSNDGTTKNET